MTDDLTVRPNLVPVTIAEKQLAIQEQTARALTTIAEFLTGGGLMEVLRGQAKSQAVTEILGGLAAHDGRGALDARTLDQDALEIAHKIERVHDKYADVLKTKKEANVDPEIHNAESGYGEWLAKEQARILEVKSHD